MKRGLLGEEPAGPGSEAAVLEAHAAEAQTRVRQPKGPDH